MARHTRQNRFAGGGIAQRPRRGGSKSVEAAHTIAAGGCWCGGPFGHIWPGKTEGEPHPRTDYDPEWESVMATSDQINHRSLRGWSREVSEIVADLVNRQGVKYRMSSGSAGLLLYPPDGESSPFRISSTRPADVQRELLIRDFVDKYNLLRVGEDTPRSQQSEVYDVPMASDPAPDPEPKPEPEPVDAVLRDTVTAVIDLLREAVGQEEPDTEEVEHLRKRVATLEERCNTEHREVERLKSVLARTNTLLDEAVAARDGYSRRLGVILQAARDES